MVGRECWNRTCRSEIANPRYLMGLKNTKYKSLLLLLSHMFDGSNHPSVLYYLDAGHQSIRRVTRHGITKPGWPGPPPRRDFTPCPNLPSSTVMFLSSVGVLFLRPGLHSHRAPRAPAVKRSAQPRGATRSRLCAGSMASTASTGPDGRCARRKARSGWVRRTSASASRPPTERGKRKREVHQKA